MGYYQRLKDLKEDADITQKQVSEIIDVSVNHYGKYERGETDIPFEKVIILAKYYDVSLDYIAGFTNYKHGEYNNEFSNDELLLIKKYRMLTERNKGKHEVLLDQLIDQQTEEHAKIKDAI